jgi:hypothetical protein
MVSSYNAIYGLTTTQSVMDFVFGIAGLFGLDFLSDELGFAVQAGMTVSESIVGRCWAEQNMPGRAVWGIKTADPEWEQVMADMKFWAEHSGGVKRKLLESGAMSPAARELLDTPISALARPELRRSLLAMYPSVRGLLAAAPVGTSFTNQPVVWASYVGDGAAYGLDPAAAGASCTGAGALRTCAAVSVTCVSRPASPPPPLPPPPAVDSSKTITSVTGSLAVSGATTDTFDAAARSAFIDTTATLIGVPPSTITITSVTSAGTVGHRRLLAGSLIVAFSVVAADEAAASALQTTLASFGEAESATLVEALQAAGLVDASGVTLEQDPTIEVVVVRIAARRVDVQPQDFLETYSVILQAGDVALLATVPSAETVGAGGMLFTFDGQPSASDTHINGVSLVGIDKDMLFSTISITCTARYVVLPDAAVPVPGFSDDKFRHLFAFDGLTAVLHGSHLYVGNALSGSTDCGDSADLAGGPDFSGATWPVDTMRNITVTVDPLGRVGILIDGRKPAAAPPPVLGPDETAPPSAACNPPTLPAGAKLFFGASGNAHYDDNFFGAAANLDIAFDVYELAA